MSWDESADYSTDVVVPKWNFGKLIAVPGGSGPPGPKGDTGAVGPVGPQGERGPQGPTTVTVGSTTTGEPGSEAAVTNVGTGQDVVLAFTVPRGEPAPNSVRQFPSLAQFPATGASDNIYIAADTGHTYRWDGSKYVGIHEAVLKAPKNVFTGKAEYNWFPFGNVFDTQLFIASLAQNPVVGTQSLYAIHRVEGDAHKDIPIAQTHDAAAVEMYAISAHNGGSLCAFEATCVVDGPGNDIDFMSSGVFNGRFRSAAEGRVGEIMVVFIDQIPPTPPNATIGTAYSLFIQPQLAGEKNFSLYVAGGDSVLNGRIVPMDDIGAALRVAANPDTAADHLLFFVEGPLGESRFRIYADGTAGVGPEVDGATFAVNNVYHPDKVALEVRQSGSQTANPVEVTSGGGGLLAGVDAGGALFGTGVFPTENGQNLKLYAFGGGVATINGNQIEIKGHTHTAGDVLGARSWVAAPASATAPGTLGQEAYDAEFYYVCVATNTWKRTPLTTW